MSACTHRHLVLLPDPRPRVRCRRCHLTLGTGELDGGFCPECYETEGVRRYDFDPVDANGPSAIRYRCEDCGILVECGFGPPDAGEAGIGQTDGTTHQPVD